MKVFALLAIACLTLAGPSTAQVMTPIIPPSQPPYNQLVTFLNLTSAQLQSLEQIQQQKNQAVQSIYQQVSQKQTQLNTLLNSGTADPLQVGQLMIDIRTLQQQAQQASKPYRQPALAVLTPDQTNKLAALVQALQLQPAASQAISLNLIDSQNTPILYPGYPGVGVVSPLAPTSQGQK
jgi:Spy/CpxP family protein refolding chaperone